MASFQPNHDHPGNILCPYENCGTYLNSSNIGYHIRLVHEKSMGEVIYQDCTKRVADPNFLEHLVSGVVSGAVSNVLIGPKCRFQDCTASFSNDTDLSKHVREVHDWPPVESMNSPKDCNPYVERYYYPSDHLKLVYEEQKAAHENSAKQLFISSFNVDRSANKEEPKRPNNSSTNSNTSNKCDASTSTKDLGAPRVSIRHPEDHTKVKCPYEDCNTYIKPNSLSNHRRLVHDKIKKACENCGKLISYLNLKSHFKRCTSDGEKRFLCEYDGCSAAFATVQYRTVHMKVVHEKIKKTCKNCGKEISYMNFKSHTEKCTSDGEKRFPCTFPGCTNAFLTKYDRSVHISAIHRSPIKCPYENCSSYIKPVGLSQHIKLVHEKIRKNCQHCGKDFGLSNWKSHESRCKKNDKTQFVDCTSNSLVPESKPNFTNMGENSLGKTTFTNIGETSMSFTCI